MVSSGEESIEPMGFSLNIPRFNRSMNRFRIKNSRPYSSSQKDPLSSVALKELDLTIGVNSDVTASDSSGSGATKKRGRAKPVTSRTKKRSRKEVLASISANAKRMAIPIPSFKMPKKRRRSDSRSIKKLSQLERAFFDDDDDDDDNDGDEKDDGSSVGSRGNGGRIASKGKTNNEGVDGTENHRRGENENKSTASSPGSSAQKSRSFPPPKDGKSSSLIGDRDTDETDSEDSDFEGKFSLPIFDCHQSQNQERNDQRPKSQPPDLQKEHQAKPNAVHENKIVESNEQAKYFIVTSPSFGASFEDTPDTENKKIENDDENNDHDTNFADFGVDSSGCDCDGIADVNCQEQPCSKNHTELQKQTNFVTSLSASSLEPAEICREESSPSPFDLERQIDLLFLKTDTNTITMKLFCKALESRMGASLEKTTKKKVKARVLSLLNGEIIPSPSVGQTFGTCLGQDKIDDGEKNNHDVDSVARGDMISEEDDNEGNNSNKQIDPEKYDSEGNKLNNDSIAETMCDVGVVNEKRSSSILNIDEAEREPALLSQEPIFWKEKDVFGRQQKEKEAICEVEVTNEKGSSSNLNIDEAEKETATTVSRELVVRKEKNVLDRRQKEMDPLYEVETTDEKRCSSNSNIDEAGQETAIFSLEPVVRKRNNVKESANASRNLPKSKKSNLCSVQIEKQKHTNINTDNRTKSKTDTSKGKRQRKSRPKVLDGGDKPTGSGAIAIPEKKPNPSRKRPRKAALCALCKTCPCQKANNYNDNENVATLDIKKFSRSDEAVEKTLIRRLQKMEKSTENLEEQTETVRRRLKKHRRDVWKRKQRELGNTDGAVAKGSRTADSYFLPDAEIFERQQNERQGLPRSIVEKSQTKVFQNVPTYQPTLFQLMGIHRDGDKIKQNTDSDLQCDNDMDNISKERASLDGEVNDYDDDVLPTDYVPERECDDRIHRMEWNNGARETTDQEIGIASGFIFDTVLLMPQEHQYETDNVNTKEDDPLPLWDDLFESQSKEDEKAKLDTEAGLDDLLCLFEDGATDSNRGDSCSVKTSKIEPRIDVSLLSQDAQDVANEVISGVSLQEKTVATLEGLCPNWKENIYFALLQKDSNEIREALENVRESRMRLQAQREQLLKAWECKNAGLQVFETALEASFARSNSNGSPSALAKITRMYPVSDKK